MLLLALKSVNWFIDESHPIVNNLLLCMFFNRLEVEVFLTSFNLQQEIFSLWYHLDCLCIEVKELLKVVFAFGDPQFEIDEVYLKSPTLYRGCVTEEIQEKKPYSSR